MAAAGNPGCFGRGRQSRRFHQPRQFRQSRQPRQPRRLLARPRLPDSIPRQPAESASRKGKGIRQICNLPPYRPHHEIHLRAPSPFHLHQTPLHGAGETFSLTPAPPVPPLRILLHIRRAGEFHKNWASCCRGQNSSQSGNPDEQRPRSASSMANKCNLLPGRGGVGLSAV